MGSTISTFLVYRHTMSPVLRYGVLVIVLSILVQYCTVSTVCSTITVLWICTGGYYTLGRDLSTAAGYAHLLYVNLLAKWRDQTVGEKFINTVERFPHKTMIVFCQETGRQKMTFKQCRDKACQVARYFLHRGYTQSL